MHAARFLFASVGLALTANYAAASIIATSYNNAANGPACYNTGCGFEGGPFFTTLQQQFKLNSASTITSVDAALSYTFNTPFTPSDLILEIVNDSGNAFGSTVLSTAASASGTLVSYPNVGFGDINFLFNSPTFDPGTYWLLLKVKTVGNLFEWEYQVPGTVDAAGTGGVINPLSGYGNTYNAGYTYLTTINGVVGSGVDVATPEPATVLTSLLALAAICAFQRRRRSY